MNELDCLTGGYEESGQQELTMTSTLDGVVLPEIDSTEGNIVDWLGRAIDKEGIYHCVSSEVIPGPTLVKIAKAGCAAVLRYEINSIFNGQNEFNIIDGFLVRPVPSKPHSKAEEKSDPSIKDLKEGLKGLRERAWTIFQRLLTK